MNDPGQPQRAPRHEFLNGRVVALSADITTLGVDAVVNAANSSLLGGGGVDGAIHRRGGPAILAACRELRRTVWPDGLPVGEAVLTTGGNLPARYVIHTVGPIYDQDHDPPALLAACYRNCIALAQAHHLRRIAFPAISTGVYGYPKAAAAAVASRAIATALELNQSVTAGVVTEVQLVFYSAADLDTFLAHQQFRVG